ncbi:competence protein CoiA family protein [Streptomyces sp. NPDC102384]|uniref:competence protein CoiA family protein n=1 Tax=Streptomyces sp. NPDC102384 TaxID=3366166 RepID=UPI003827E641
MAFLVQHAMWGTIDATVRDLGCGRSWDAVHRARPSAPLNCRECRHGMVAVHSPRGLRFFRHAPRAPRCSMAGGESLEHHLLKLELAQAARSAGFHAEYEVGAPDGSWRADVMATSADGTRRVALEAQLSPIAVEDIRARTDRYETEGIAVCWFGVAPRPWLGSIPSLLLDSPQQAGTSWTVRAGIARMTADDFTYLHWAPVQGVSLTDAIAWIMSDRMRPHSSVWLAPIVHGEAGQGWAAEWTGPNLEKWQMWWTAPRYIEADVQQEREFREQAEYAKLVATLPMDAFRERTGIERLSTLKSLICGHFSNNVTRTPEDFSMRFAPEYEDGMAFYGYRWTHGMGKTRDRKPFIVVYPNLRSGQTWDHDVPVAFPASIGDQLPKMEGLWLFDLAEKRIWPAAPRRSVVSAAMESWNLTATVDTQQQSPGPDADETVAPGHEPPGQ